MVRKANGEVPYHRATLRGNSNIVMSECASDGTSLEDAEKLSELLSVEQISRLSNTTSSLSQPVCVVSNNTNAKPSISIPVSILIESLVKNICSIYEADPNKASLMYNRICDKLYSMNLLSESYSMTEFEGIRSQYQRALLHLISSTKNGSKDNNVPVKPKWLNSEVNSHYRREFDEVEFIAGGGFGQVYRVKHKLDGTEYAIKKIPIRSEGIQSVRTYLSEVKTFASMNHPNIVQYKGAWLEIGAPSHRAITDKPDHGDLHEANSNTKYIYHELQSFTEER
ncbi:unnamed protein product [Acanthoscelides obtectus]|uniref:non-specific serine/threonine protein kinase n=1 Tax=Acanthoscelides obtectus TaxID=200917 RepID=A0A9P0PTC9_ACAOB|nr:unnamed protein product [Acanthoscelides obtectus]CAK1677465.1 Eukaryotic translation initiation factor 2-alpha kinase 1 [Acanthoscelides obtectus]